MNIPFINLMNKSKDGKKMISNLNFILRTKTFLCAF